MDITSSVVGFIDTGVKIAKFVWDTIEDLKSAPKQLQSLSKPISRPV